MSEDKRERILLRLHAVITALAADQDETTYAWRNRAEFNVPEQPTADDTPELPAFVLLDGIETRVTRSSDRRGPQLMQLEPQIFFVPVPTENQLNTDMGPKLSAMRVDLIKAVMQDGQLQDLVGDNGYVEYRGMETDMQTGAEVKGQFKMDFAFAYLFNFNKL